MNDINHPLVSIIMPSYNHGRHIAKSIDSIIKQTYTNWELIIVDNNSTDNTKKILSKYENNDKIKTFYVKNNGIIAYSRNIGIKNSRADYIAFIDSDDIWLNNKLEICIPVIKSYDLIYHDMSIYFQHKPKKNKVSRKFNLEGNILKKLLMNGNPIVNSSVITKKNILEKIGFIDEHPSINRSVDYNTWLKIARETNNFKYVPNVLGKNLIHENNLSNINMESSTRAAAAEFLIELNSDEIKTFNARLKYIDIKYNYDSGNNNKNLKGIFFCLKHGTFDLKLKALFLLIMNSFKINK